MVVLQAQAVVYVTITGSASAQFELTYDAEGTIGFDQNNPIQLKLNLGTGEFDTGNWAPVLQNAFHDSWKYKASGTLALQVTAHLGVDFTVIINGISTRITPAVTGYIDISGNIEKSRGEAVKSELTAKVGLGAQVRAQLSLAPFTDQLGRRRRLLPDDSRYAYQQLVTAYEDCPTCIAEKIRNAGESGEIQIGDDVSTKYVNLFDMMQATCIQIGQVLGCSVIESICKNAINIIKQFGWNGDIPIPISAFKWDQTFKIAGSDAGTPIQYEKTWTP